MIIPRDNWRQINTNDYLGSIYVSKNLDLNENAGRLRIGNRLLLNQSTTDNADFLGVPVGFRHYIVSGTGKYYTVMGNGTDGWVFSSSTLGGDFTKITGGGAPVNLFSDTDDIEVFNGKLVVSSSAATKYYHTTNGTSWTGVTAGGTGQEFMLCAYNDRLYNTLGGIQIQSSEATLTTVTSPTTFPNTNPNSIILADQNLLITFLRAFSDGIWIGTVNKAGGRGQMFKWNGAQAGVNSSYKLESSGALACTILDDVPYIMDSNGALLVFNGGTFVEVARLNRINRKLLFNPFYITNQRFVHPNGMGLVDGKINIVIDGTNFDVASHGGSQEETIPSGIWEYDRDIGLYHKQSFGLSKTGGSIVDYGQTRIYRAGGINEIITAQSPITTDGKLLVGASFRTDSTLSSSGAISGIFYDNSDDDEQKSGYLITTKIGASEIKQAWHRLSITFKKFLDSTDKIVVKYRTEDSVPTEMAITWTSTSTFTTTTNILAYHPNTLGYGAEVEIQQGQGSGQCAHITNIEVTGGVYTVTLDDTFSTASSGTARAKIQEWKKSSSYSARTDANYDFPIGVNSEWIQFKIYAVFTGKDEIIKLQLVNTVAEFAK